MKMSFSSKTSLLGAIVMLVSLVSFVVYGIMYDYFDTAVFVAVALGVICAVGYAKLHTIWAEYLNLIAVICIAFAVGLFFLNSYPVWADRLNNITMYASRGTLVPVITIMIMMFVAIIVEVVSCFTSKEGE